MYTKCKFTLITFQVRDMQQVESVLFSSEVEHSRGYKLACETSLTKYQRTEIKLSTLSDCNEFY